MVKTLQAIYDTLYCQSHAHGLQISQKTHEVIVNDTAVCYDFYHCIYRGCHI